jgi:hypothetical protein
MLRKKKIWFRFLKEFNETYNFGLFLLISKNESILNLFPKTALQKSKDNFFRQLGELFLVITQKKEKKILLKFCILDTLNTL